MMKTENDNAGWQPIETAPKDGTYVLLAGPSGYMGTPLRVEVCRYDFKYRPLNPWQTYANDAFTDSGPPATHWMPLPPSPRTPMSTSSARGENHGRDSRPGDVYVEPGDITDTDRLNWLDSVMVNANARNGTCYGWRFDINHNRAALTNNNIPALNIREAIDAART